MDDENEKEYVILKTVSTTQITTLTLNNTGNNEQDIFSLFRLSWNGESLIRSTHRSTGHTTLFLQQKFNEYTRIEQRFE